MSGDIFFRGLSKTFQPKPNPITDDYELAPGHVLGTGASGKVIECISKTNGQKYALKTLRDVPRARREVEIHWKSSECKQIVSIIDVYENTLNGEKCLLVVSELMEGGELFQRIQERAEGAFTEREAARIVLDICKAIEYLHSRDIAHRDLKPENLLYTGKGPDAMLKLIDFGFAKYTDKSKTLLTPCFTPFYVAPEVLRHVKYDKSCDMWALGVITYILLSGYPPFDSSHGAPLTPGMTRKIRKGQYEFPPKIWSHISKEAKDFIRGLLITNPDKRMSIHQAMKTKWIAEHMLVPATPLTSGHVLKEDQERWNNVKAHMSNRLSTMRDESPNEQVQLILDVSKLDISKNPILAKRKQKNVASK